MLKISRRQTGCGIRLSDSLDELRGSGAFGEVQYGLAAGTRRHSVVFNTFTVVSHVNKMDKQNQKFASIRCVLMKTLSTVSFECVELVTTMETLSVKLTKQSVSHCTFLSPKTNGYCCWFIQTSSILPPPRPVWHQKSHAPPLSHTPHFHINQAFICLLHTARPALCLSVTVSADETHACQNQSGCRYTR